MNFNDKIISVTNQYQTICLKDEPLSKYTSFKIGGPADYFIKANCEQVISDIIKLCNQEGIPYFVMGKGSNLLVSDDGYKGVMIYLGPDFSAVTVNDDEITCLSGATLTQVANEALKYSLTGFEFAYGIPGTVGGAVYMNAGAYGGEIKDVLIKSKHIDQNGDFHQFDSSECDFAYRHSAYSDKNYCITSAVFKLTHGNYNEIKEKMDDLMNRRISKQPLEYPSAGSTFKRPQGNYASALIEQCGLKGFRVGGAEISTKHSGFVINTGNATCKDVLMLTQKVKEIVFEKTGYVLDLEVRLL